MINGPRTYRAIAQMLPYDIRAALLAIRDDGLTTEKIPSQIYIAMHELMLIEADGETGANLRLSRLGNHLVDFCII